MGGFDCAFPAYVHDEVDWHSDMLPVRPRFRGFGIGQDLKWAQRDHALRNVIERIARTFDPV